MREIPSKTTENSQETWARPALKAMNPKTDSVSFHQLEIDEYMASPNLRITPDLQAFSQVPVVRFFGVNDVR